MSFCVDSSVEKLCKDIGDIIDRNGELRSSLDQLLTICDGPVEGIRNPINKVLNAEELLLTILKINKCPEHLKNKADLCVKILNTLFSLSRNKEWKIVVSLTKVVLKSNFQDKSSFVEDVWSKKDIYMFPVELVVLLINHDPVLIEKELCKLYFTRECKDLWKNDKYQCWIPWCSQSSELFLIVTSILNQFVINAKAMSVILKVVSDFITNVMAECEKHDKVFFSLYPLEYQSFAASLIIEPNLNPYKKDIINKLKYMKQDNITLMLLFLSHFPSWIDLVDL